MLAEFALAIARLRAMLPEDLPEQAAEHWLEANRPNWQAELPLRLSREVLEQLVRPALTQARDTCGIVAGPRATRETHRSEAGIWQAFLRLAEQGFLPFALLPGASELRLRLLPRGGASEFASGLV